MSRQLVLSMLSALVLALAGPARAETKLYLVETLAAEADHAPLRAQAQELEAIYADLAKQAGVEAQLVWSTDPDLNAFATEVGDEKIVVVQEGLLTKFASDRDAVAAVLGHELAHHKADHIRAGKRKQQNVRVLGAILGAVVGAKVGRNSGELAGAVAGTAVGVGADLLALKFSRTQELEADRLAVDWMIRAGYNPEGMLRLQQQLGAMAEGKRRAAILSTHPTSAKRYQAAEKAISKLAPAPELLSRETAPLVGADALAAAEAAIEQAEVERIASVPNLPAPAELPAAALAPIRGFSVEALAALSNEIMFVGDANKARVLSKHRLTDEKLQAINVDFATRLQQYPGLAQHYDAGFYRASQGRWAAWGHDLATSYDTGQALVLEPPLSLASFRLLTAQAQSRHKLDDGTIDLLAFEREILQPKQLTLYDYMIASSWWTRRAELAAISGDTALLQEFAKPLENDEEARRAEAEAAGVHIGENVQIGKNVRIGKKDKSEGD